MHHVAPMGSAKSCIECLAEAARISGFEFRDSKFVFLDSG